jgi:hypothetical protein
MTLSSILLIQHHWATPASLAFPPTAASRKYQRRAFLGYWAEGVVIWGEGRRGRRAGGGAVGEAGGGRGEGGGGSGRES